MQQAKHRQLVLKQVVGFYFVWYWRFLC